MGRILVLLAFANPCFAVDKDEVRKAFALERGEVVITSSPKDVFAWERMKMRSDYPNDLSKATKEGQLFVLWTDYEDASLYGWFLENFPDAMHSFCQSTDAGKGIVLGRVEEGKVKPVREVDAYTLSAPKIKEVILTTITPSKQIRPRGTEPRPFSEYTRDTTAPDRFGMGLNMSGVVVGTTPSQALTQTAPIRMAPAQYAAPFGSTNNCTVY